MKWEIIFEGNAVVAHAAYIVVVCLLDVENLIFQMIFHGDNNYKMASVFKPRAMEEPGTLKAS